MVQKVISQIYVEGLIIQKLMKVDGKECLVTVSTQSQFSAQAGGTKACPTCNWNSEIYSPLFLSTH